MTSMEMEKLQWRSLRESWQEQVIDKNWIEKIPKKILISGKMNEADIQKMVDKVDFFSILFLYYPFYFLRLMLTMMDPLTLKNSRVIWESI